MVGTIPWNSFLKWKYFLKKAQNFSFKITLFTAFYLHFKIARQVLQMRFYCGSDFFLENGAFSSITPAKAPQERTVTDILSNNALQTHSRRFPSSGNMLGELITRIGISGLIVISTHKQILGTSKLIHAQCFICRSFCFPPFPKRWWFLRSPALQSFLFLEKLSMVFNMQKLFSL